MCKKFVNHNLLKESAVKHGRKDDEIMTFTGVMVAVADTYEEAMERRLELLDYASPQEFEGQMLYLSGMIGINLMQLDWKNHYLNQLVTKLYRTIMTHVQLMPYN